MRSTYLFSVHRRNTLARASPSLHPHTEPKFLLRRQPAANGSSIAIAPVTFVPRDPRVGNALLSSCSCLPPMACSTEYFGSLQKIILRDPYFLIIFDIFSKTLIMRKFCDNLYFICFIYKYIKIYRHIRYVDIVLYISKSVTWVFLELTAAQS